MMKKAFTPLERKRNSKDNYSSLTGFTLLELVVVIIILGVLATLGITQYGRMVERARIAEVWMVMGDIRKLGYAYWLANGTTVGMPAAALNLGPDPDQIPYYGCRPSHYFMYTYGGEGTDLRFYAYRCPSGGKPPQGPGPGWRWIRAASWDYASGLMLGYNWSDDGGSTWVSGPWP